MVWRGDSGKSYVSDAYSTQLGTNFNVGGNVNEECVEFPSLGWCFSGSDGKLTKMPHSNSGRKRIFQAKNISENLMNNAKRKRNSSTCYVYENLGVNGNEWIYLFVV